MLRLAVLPTRLLVLLLTTILFLRLVRLCALRCCRLKFCPRPRSLPISLLPLIWPLMLSVTLGKF